MTVTPDGRTLYVAENTDEILPVDLSTGMAGIPINVGNPDLTSPLALAVTPDGRTLYVAVNYINGGGGPGSNSLVAINTATGAAARPSGTVRGRSGLWWLRRTGEPCHVVNGNYSDSISTVIPVSTADGRPGAAIRTGGLFSDAAAHELVCLRLTAAHPLCG